MKAQSGETHFSSPMSDFALIKITEWSGDDMEAKIYRISANVFNLLNKYLEEGFVAREIRHELLHTLSSLPAWANLDLDSLNTTQRQAVVGMYIADNFVELQVDCEISISNH